MQNVKRNEKLPRHPESAQNNLCDEGKSHPASAPAEQALGQCRYLQSDKRLTQRRPALHAPRRPTLCQRRYPHGPCNQQGAQGHRRKIQNNDRLQRPLRPRLGLSRPADRGQSHGRTRR